VTTCLRLRVATRLREAMGVRKAPHGWVALMLSAWLGCAASQALSAPATMPSDAELRRTSLRDLGQRLFDGLRAGSLEPNFANVRELDLILVPDARLQLERERARWQQRSFGLVSFRSDWSSASFVGFCAQGARVEPPHAGLGLTQAGWVLDRILVVARPETAGPPSASWLEGDFVYTGQGWRVLSLRRVEPPRRHHADLELAPCDVEAGLR
jgi:hypothetical protein